MVRPVPDLPGDLESLVWSALWILVHVVLQTAPALDALSAGLAHRAYHLAARTAFRECRAAWPEQHDPRRDA